MSDPTQFPPKINSQPIKPSAVSSSITPPSPTGIINYLREENKATIASCSSELHNCPATNLLNAHRNRIWMSEEGLPQSVTIDISHLADRPRAFKCIGWDCWHDYITNPATVEISVSQDGQVFITWITLRTELKQGVQLFDIDAIYRMYNFIKFTILSSHGGSKVYMNAVYLLETNPESNNINLSIPPIGSPSSSQLEQLQPSHRIPYYSSPHQPQELSEQQQLQQQQQQQYQVEEQSWEQQEQEQLYQDQQQLQPAREKQHQHLHNNNQHIAFPNAAGVAATKQFHGQSQQQAHKTERYNQHPYQGEQQSQQQQQQHYSARQSSASSSQHPSQVHPSQQPQHQYVNSAVNDLRLNGVHSVTSYQGDRAKSTGNGSIFYSPGIHQSPVNNNNATNPSSFIVDPFLQGYIPQQQQYQQDLNGRKELVIDGNQSGFSGFEGGGAAAPSGLRELMPEFDGKSSSVSSRSNNNNSHQDIVSHWHSPNHNNNNKHSIASVSSNPHNPQSRGEFSKQLMAQQANQLVVEQKHIQNDDRNNNLHNRNSDFEQFKHSYHSNHSQRIQEPYQEEDNDNHSHFQDRDHSRKDSDQSNHHHHDHHRLHQQHGDNEGRHNNNNNIDMRLFDQGVISYREGDKQYYQHQIPENIPANSNDQQHSRANTLNNSTAKQQHNRHANLSPLQQQQQQHYCNLDDSSNAIPACVVELKQEVKQLRDQLYSTQQSVAVLGEVAYKLQDTKNVIIEKLSLIQESLLCFKQEIYERLSAIEERDKERDQENQNGLNNKQILPANLNANDKCPDKDNNHNVLGSYLPQQTHNQEGNEEDDDHMRSHNAKSIEHDKVDSELLLKAVKEMIDKRVGTIENGLSHTLAGLLNTPGQQQQQLFSSTGKSDKINSSSKQQSKRTREIITSISPRESDDDNAPYTPQSQRLHEASQSSHSNNNNNSLQDREITKVSSQKEPIAMLLKQLQEKLALRQTKVEELNSQKQHLKRKGAPQSHQAKQQMDKQETSKRYA